MKLKDSWSQNYKNGLKSTEKGELDTAYNYGTECLSIVEKIFKTGSIEEQVSSLDMYLKSILLLKTCSEVKNCISCIENHYLTGIYSLSKIHGHKVFHLQVRLKAGELVLRIKKETIDFYLTHNMKCELELFRKKLKQNFKGLILVD